jgi:NAD+ kinase
MAGSRTRVAIVGGDRAVAAVDLEAIASEAGTSRGDAPAAIAMERVDPDRADVVLAVGERGLMKAARAGVEAPIVAVELDEDPSDGPRDTQSIGFPDGGSRYAVDIEGIADVLDRIAGGEGHAGVSTVEHPLLAVSVDGEPVDSALFDVTLVTSEPARISEYGVRGDGEDHGTFRADAVTVATPIGSTGYARRAGGPVSSPGTGLVVVPIAPFSTRTDTWVLRSPVTLSVERDEEPVSLVIDDEERRGVETDEPVSIVVDDQVRIVVPAPADSEAGLEKL